MSAHEREPALHQAYADGGIHDSDGEWLPFRHIDDRTEIVAAHMLGDSPVMQRAAAAIAALEAEGYTVARLREFRDEQGESVYRIIDAPAVEEAEPWARDVRPGDAGRLIAHYKPTAAPAGTECPTCGGNGEFLDALAKGADRYVPCPTCSPNETSEQ